MNARSTNTLGFVHFGHDVVAGVEEGIGVRLGAGATGGAGIIEAISDSDTAALTIRAKGAAVLTLGNSSNTVTVTGGVSLGNSTLANLSVSSGSTLGSLNSSNSTLANLSVTGGSTLGNLNSSNSTLANLSVTGGSTLGNLVSSNSTLAALSVSGGSTLATLHVSSNSTFAGTVKIGTGETIKGIYSTTFAWANTALGPGLTEDISLSTTVGDIMPGDLVDVSLGAPSTAGLIVAGVRYSTAAASRVTITIGNIKSTTFSSTGSGTGRVSWIDLT